MNGTRKPLVVLQGEIRTPPFSAEARLEAGTLLRHLQEGETLGMPHSRPMPSVGKSCHELRIRDEDRNWRIIYRIETEAIVIAEIFEKTTRTTPQHVIDNCKRRLALRDEVARAARKKAEQETKKKGN